MKNKLLQCQEREKQERKLYHLKVELNEELIVFFVRGMLTIC